MVKLEIGDRTTFQSSAVLVGPAEGKRQLMPMPEPAFSQYFHDILTIIIYYNLYYINKL